MQHNTGVRLAPAMRLSGRIIASIASSWFLAVFIGEAVSCNPGPFEWAGTTLVLVGLVAIAGTALSWCRVGPGAIALLLTSALIGVHIAVYAGRWHLLMWTVLGLPYLLAGLLLLGSLRIPPPPSGGR
jgi:hypothetical protein